MPRSEALNVMVRYKADQYHLIRLDLSENRNQGDVLEFIFDEYLRYRGSCRNLLSPWTPTSVEYVRVGVMYFSRFLS
jgi:hypothetical protein